MNHTIRLEIRTVTSFVNKRIWRIYPCQFTWHPQQRFFWLVSIIDSISSRYSMTPVIGTTVLIASLYFLLMKYHTSISDYEYVNRMLSVRHFPMNKTNKLPILSVQTITIFVIELSSCIHFYKLSGVCNGRLYQWFFSPSLTLIIFYFTLLR